MSKNLKTAVYVGAFVLAIAVIAAFVHPAAALPVAGLGTLLALTVPPTLSARNSGEQQLHFYRFRFTSANIPAMAAGVKICRLPARAFINSIALHVSTAFNSATTDTIQLGSTASGVDILAAGTSIHTAGYLAPTTPAGLGIVVATTGEQDVYLKYSQTGGAATAGDFTLIITYIPDSDQ
jgi:hypothetical protein